jgi:DNA-binding phage protein
VTESQAIRGIHQALRQRERAERARREAADNLRAKLRAAQGAGVSITRIAQEAGLSRQGVYDLLAERPS